MYRVPAIAVLLAAAAFPPSLEGQMRAIQRPRIQVNVGPRFRLPPPSSGFGVMSPRSFGRRALFVGPVAFRHNLRFNIFFGNSCFTSPFFDPFFCRQFFFRNRFLFAQPVFLPYPVYTAPYYQVAEQSPVATADRESDLAREIDRLRDEVERMREEQLSREQARQAALQPRPSVEDKPAPTILVFRDGRRSKVQNFAIAGQTLWMFTEQRARKIPVSDLDLAATKVRSSREEEERGQPPYHPLMMTKILVYGYCVGVFSSRKIHQPGGQANGKQPYWQTDYGDIAPRVAFAWSPSSASGLMKSVLGDHGKTSIRGGIGLYYDHFGQGVVDSFNSIGSFGLSTSVTNPLGVLTVDQSPRFSATNTIPTTAAGGCSTPPCTILAPPFPTGTSFGPRQSD